MFPTLFKLGPLTFHTYGLLVALGLVLGSRIAVWNARRSGLEKNQAEDVVYQLLLYFTVGGVLGGRLFHVVEFWHEFSDAPMDIFKIWQGGLVSYGGLAGALMAFSIWVRKNPEAPWKKWLDWIAPSLALGHAVGRLGCFAAGCCYGNSTDAPWAVVFTHMDSLAPLGVPVHPTQLYEAAFLALLGAFLLWRLPRNKKDGGLFSEYLALYSAARFALEFLRADPRVLGPLTAGHLFSLVVFITAFAFRFKLAHDPRPS